MMNPSVNKDPKEQAYLYDLYIVPQWRELFDRMIDDDVKLPDSGRFLEVECGTGNYTLDLAQRFGQKIEITGIDESVEKLNLALGKAEISKLENLNFSFGTLESLGVASDSFDVVIADLSLISPPDLTERLPAILAELQRVLTDDGLLVLKLTTRGSFDEFYSFYWQVLYELEWEEYTPEIEALINERFTVDEIIEQVKNSGFRNVRSEIEANYLKFENGEAFLSNPLIKDVFLDHWLSIFGTEAEVGEFKANLIETLDRDGDEGGFEISAKTTIVIAHR